MQDQEQDQETYVTVARFVSSVNAQLAKGMLESAGIECFLQGENANNLIGSAFRARLQVHEKDEASARAMLDGAIDELGEADESDQ